MTIYDEMQSVARELLAEFKQGVVSYVKMTPGNGPVDNPGPAVPTSYPINSAVQGVQIKYVNQQLAVASDLQVIAPFDPAYVPELTGFVDVDGVRYKIVNIVKKPAAGTVVVYVLIIRRGME